MFKVKSGGTLTQTKLRSAVLLLRSVFEKFIKVSINEFGINPLFCLDLPDFTWEYGLKDTGKNLQTLQDKDSILTKKNIIRGGISSVMGDKYVKSDEKKAIWMVVVYMAIL